MRYTRLSWLHHKFDMACWICSDFQRYINISIMYLYLFVLYLSTYLPRVSFLITEFSTITEGWVVVCSWDVICPPKGAAKGQLQLGATNIATFTEILETKHQSQALEQGGHSWGYRQIHTPHSSSHLAVLRQTTLVDAGKRRVGPRHTGRVDHALETGTADS